MTPLEPNRKLFLKIWPSVIKCLKFLIQIMVMVFMNMNMETQTLENTWTRPRSIALLQVHVANHTMSGQAKSGQLKSP